MTNLACLACGAVHPGAREVALHDGRTVSSYSEAWRQEAEAMSIMSLPTKTDRRYALSTIEKHRGKQTADQLRELVNTLYSLRVARQRETV